MSLQGDMPCELSIDSPLSVDVGSTGCFRSSIPMRARRGADVSAVQHRAHRRERLPDFPGGRRFTANELNIEVKENALTIRGESRLRRRAERRSALSGYRARTFERRFQLADHVVFKGAAVENGSCTWISCARFRRRRSRARFRRQSQGSRGPGEGADRSISLDMTSAPKPGRLFLGGRLLETLDRNVA